MQHMMIVGLDNLEDDRTKRIAQDWAQRWVQGNYLAFKETGAMFEKVASWFRRIINLTESGFILVSRNRTRRTWRRWGI